jgi:hypothetical protein
MFNLRGSSSATIRTLNEDKNARVDSKLTADARALMDHLQLTSDERRAVDAMQQKLTLQAMELRRGF